MTDTLTFLLAYGPLMQRAIFDRNLRELRGRGEGGSAAGGGRTFQLQYQSYLKASRRPSTALTHFFVRSSKLLAGGSIHQAGSSK